MAAMVLLTLAGTVYSFKIIEEIIEHIKECHEKHGHYHHPRYKEKDCYDKDGADNDNWRMLEGGNYHHHHDASGKVSHDHHWLLHDHEDHEDHHCKKKERKCGEGYKCKEEDCYDGNNWNNDR